MGVVQRLREATKVMNRGRRLHRGHSCSTGKPVSRNHHNRLRAWQCHPQLLPAAGIQIIFQHVHRTTVT